MGSKSFRDIIFIGSVGETGALKLAESDKNLINERFPKHIVKKIEKLREQNQTVSSGITGEIKEVLSKCNILEESCFCELGVNGFMSALWHLGEAIGSGFVTEADKVPVSQLTIEICELFGADPYRIACNNCFLLCVRDGNRVYRELVERDIRASVIGHTHEKKGRLFLMGEVCRYVEKTRIL